MKLADFWLPYAKIRAKVANLATLHVYRYLRERCYVAHVIIIRSLFFVSRRRRHTISTRDWSSDVCSSDLRKGDRDEPRPGSTGDQLRPRRRAGDRKGGVVGSAVDRGGGRSVEERRVRG